MDGVEIVVHKRTGRSGHLTAAMDLEGAVRFADAELAQGRFVIVEFGAESLVVRVGREIADFVRRLWKGVGKVTVTTMVPLRGGQEERTGYDSDLPLGAAGPTGAVEMPPAFGDFDGVEEGGRRARRVGRSIASPEAEVRAWRALVDRIGERTARGMLAGGGYAVRSKLWPHLLYVVTPETVKVVNQGMQVSRICIVATDGGSVWDAVLSRIQLLESGADGEVQVFATGQLQRG